MSILNKFFKDKKGPSIFEEYLHSEISFIQALNVREAEEPKNFYQDQKSDIQSFLAGWQLNPVDDFGRCGYDYTIKLFSGDTFATYASLCFHCERIKIDKMIYQLEREVILNQFNNYLKEAKTIIHSFQGRKEGRLFWAQEKSNPLLINAEFQAPAWEIFDGSFNVPVIFPNVDDLSSEDIEARLNEEEEKLDKKLKELRKKRGPDGAEPYQSESSYLNHSQYDIGRGSMQFRTGSELTTFLSVDCSKGFYDDIQDIEMESFQRFRDLRLELLYRSE